MAITKEQRIVNLLSMAQRARRIVSGAFAVEQAEDFAQEEMDAENFIEVFGDNTDYVIDPEECMADNFGYALT